MASYNDKTPVTPAQIGLFGDWLATTRGFGVELECVWPVAKAATESDMRAALEQAGFPYWEGERSFPTGWYYGGDRCAQYAGWTGREICTPILRGEEGLAYLRRLMTFLRDDMGARVNFLCGMHVHIGVDDLSREQKARVTAAFLRYERFFDALIAPARYINRYPRATAPGIAYHQRSDGFTNASSDLRPTLPVGRTLRTQKERDQDARTLLREIVARAHVDVGGKFRHRGPTYEMRAHQGSINPDHAEHWVRLVTAFTDVAANKPLAEPRRLLMEVDEKITVRTFEAFLRLWKLPKATRKYLAEQRIALMIAHPYGNEDWDQNPTESDAMRYVGTTFKRPKTIQEALAILEPA